MRNNYLLTFVILIFPCYGSSWLAENELNTTFYNSMPKLFKMDNFEECSETVVPVKLPKLYCILNVNLAARSNNNLMNEIVKFSSSKNNFNHAHSLKVGVCLSNCLLVHKFLKDKYEQYLNDKSTVSDVSIAQGRLNMINKLANVCINKELMDYYGLLAETTVDYCVFGDQTEIEPLDKLFAIAILGLIFMFSMSAVYESKRNKFKRLDNWPRIQRYLFAFSIKQNWYALFDNENSSNLERYDNDKNVTQLCVIKIFIMFLFVLNQVYRQIASMPFANPIYVEKTINGFFYNLFNEDSIINAFFTISGIYTSFSLVPFLRKSQEKFYKMLWKIFNSRQDLIFSLVAASTLLYSSVFSKALEKPFWRHSTSFEMRNCRRNWKYNLLLAQNYVKSDEMCMEPTWIFTAEVHLILIGFLYLYVIEKFQKYLKYLIGLTIITSAAVVASRIYLFNLAPFSFITPEILRNNHLIKDPKLQEIFYSTHMNAGNFIIGLIFGYLILNKINLGKFKSRAHSIVSIAAYFLLPATFKFLILDNFIRCHFGMALIGAYLKHHDGFFLSVILINWIFGDEKEWILKFSKNGVFRILDKLFYAAFFSQLLITKILIGNTNVLIEMRAFNLFAYSCGIFIISYILAVVIYMTIQAPCIMSRSKVSEPEMSKKSDELKSSEDTDEKKVQ